MSPILDWAQLAPTSDIVRITRFDITDRMALAALPTVALRTGSVIDIITGVGTGRAAAEVELQDGIADALDSSQIQPSDDLTRHWQVVGGVLP